MVVMVESFDKTWSVGEGNDKLLQYSYLENPTNCMKTRKDMTLKDELPRFTSTTPPVVDVAGDGSKVWCCREQYHIGMWNVRSW